MHYGLVGANGVGKSTLLKVMANKQLIGFPKSIRTLYVDQIEIASDTTEVRRALARLGWLIFAPMLHANVTP